MPRTGRGRRQWRGGRRWVQSGDGGRRDRRGALGKLHPGLQPDRACPDLGSTWLLPRLIGRQRALELMLTNEPLSADLAKEWGLVREVFDDAALRDGALALARKLASGPTRALVATRRLIEESEHSSYADQFRREIETQAEIRQSADALEGRNAFLEKRAARFSGRRRSCNMKIDNVADLIAETLAQAGVKRIFGVVGDSLRSRGRDYRSPSYTMKPRAIASLRKARGTSFSGRCRVAPRRHLEILQRAEIALERRQQSGQADRRMRAAVERQQQQFQMRGRAVFRGRGDAGNRGQHFFGDVTHDVLDLAAALWGEQRREAAVLEVAAEQGADPGSGDAKGVAGFAFVSQHEDVAEQFAYRTWFDLATVRRARIAAFCVPIGEKLAARWVFHGSSLAPARALAAHICPAFAHALSLVCCAGQALQRPCRGRDLAGEAGFALLTLN